MIEKKRTLYVIFILINKITVSNYLFFFSIYRGSKSHVFVSMFNFPSDMVRCDGHKELFFCMYSDDVS